jgi:hypothetical protein
MSSFVLVAFIHGRLHAPACRDCFPRGHNHIECIECVQYEHTLRMPHRNLEVLRIEREKAIATQKAAELEAARLAARAQRVSAPLPKATADPWGGWKP